MSFILDALKKSEMDRQRQASPALFEVKVAAPRRELPVLALSLGGLLLITLLVLAWVLLRPAQLAAPASAALPVAGTPGMVTVPATVTIPTTVQIPASAAPAVSMGVAPEEPGVVAPSSAPPLAEEPQLSGNEPSVPPDYNANDYVTAVTPAEARAAAARRGSSLPSRDEVISQGQALPELRLDLHGYNSNPAERFVFINMRKLREGDVTAEGVRVDAITETGVHLSYRGQRFALGGS